MKNGNRASRLLAFRLKKQQSSNIVQKLKGNNAILTKPDEILQSLAEFYKTLYKKKAPAQMMRNWHNF